MEGRREMEREREEIFSMYWFTLQVPTAARVGLAGCKEPLGVLILVAASQVF